ncbi:MAG: DUF4372 domain-containing protein [Spirochaetes bacterium]|nr:DUF4372 domain-containing protein [Spirochaetota bacterium]MBN2771595.1 DUF4372 domain-containing protein [Spirochaetota bacterium]
MQSIIFGYNFKKVVHEHNGNKRIKEFTTANLMSVMPYVYLTAKEILRDISDSLMNRLNVLYHLGLSSISRNNLSHALQIRSAKIFEKTFYMLLGQF